MHTTLKQLTGSLGKNTYSYLKPKVEPAGYVMAELADDTWRLITTTIQENPVVCYAQDAISFWRQHTTARKYLKGLDHISVYRQHEKFWENETGQTMPTEGDVDEVDSPQSPS